MGCCGDGNAGTTSASTARSSGLRVNYSTSYGDPHLKVVQVGDAGVGKSTLLIRVAENRYCSADIPTIGVELRTLVLDVADRKVKISCWDTAGQERFAAIVATYYRNIHAAMVMYDMTDENSFLHVRKWVKEVKTYCPSAPLLVVGCKSDAVPPGEEIDIQRLGDMIDGPYKAIETSARDNCGIDQVRNFLNGVADDYLRQRVERQGQHTEQTN